VTSLSDSGAGSLRAAIANANATQAAETICLPPGRIELLTASSAGSPFLLTVTSPLTLRGPSARDTVVDGNRRGTVFVVEPGVTLKLEGLTITGGSGADFNGGGVLVRGRLEILECTFKENTAVYGGGVRLDSAVASLLVVRSTFERNQGSGGAIESQQGSMVIENSTITGNTGTAIRLSNAGSIDIRNSTVVNNAGGAVEAVGGFPPPDVFLFSSIVTDSVVSNNLHEDFTIHDAAGLNLGVLQDNGGGTDTMLPGPGSTARGAGSNGYGYLTDQRGNPRGTASVDAGAVEVP
jgi:hypothetical protein